MWFSFISYFLIIVGEMMNYFTDRSWMYQQRRKIGGSISEHFNDDVHVFIDFALSNNGNDEEIRCPCSR